MMKIKGVAVTLTKDQRLKPTTMIKNQLIWTKKNQAMSMIKNHSLIWKPIAFLIESQINNKIFLFHLFSSRFIVI